MTLEDKKEIVKAKFYEYSDEFIMENYSISKDELNKILEENKDYLKELEGRDYA